MKHKKGLIFICLLICLFSIASVAASDVNETVVASENQMVDDEMIAVEEQEVSEVGATDEYELSATTGTFTDLANEIENAGDELNLTRDYSYFDNDSSYKEGITINKKITINGNGFTINGNNQARIFYISYNGNCVLNNIFFVNCSSSSGAGAIDWNSGYGGTILNCRFMNCSSSLGGAIYFYYGKNSILNCSFLNCSSKNMGAAIYFNYGGNSILNSSFVNCSSKDDGGIIYFDQGINSIEECNFINLKSKSISGYNSRYNIYNSKFTNCQGIYKVNCIFNSIFTECRSISLSYDNFVISNCSFVNCSKSSDSAVYCSGNNGTLFNCSFVNCSTYYPRNYYGFGGAAVNWAGANGTLFNCSFVNCSSLSPSASNNNGGGAIRWNGVNGSLSNSKFLNCTSVEGGAIYWSSEGTIINCFFKGNKANNANTIYIKEKSFSEETFINNNHVYDENPFRADINQIFEDIYDGDYLNIDKDYKTIRNTTIYITNNNIVINGHNHIINSIDCNYKFFKITGNNVTIQNIIFVNFNSTSKYSSQYGGVIEWIGNNGHLSNCTFINCSFLSEYHVTYSNGGAIYCTGSNNTLMNCNFINCSSEYYGGAIYCEGDNNTLINCNFSNCISKYEGAAIKWQGSYGILKDCSFNNCLLQSSTTSGVITWIGINGSLFNCSFSNSSQTNIYWGGENGAIYKCSFTNCSSSTRGSAIYWNGNNGILSDCRFLNSNGSCVVYWYGIHGLLNNCSFINCSSRTNGGAIYWWGKNGVLNNSIFTNCSSSKYGGSVCWDADYGILSNCTFINSSANESGGAIYWEHSNGVVINCIFINCSSINKGKFIYWTQKNGTLYNCSFDGDKYNYGLYCFVYYYKFDSKLSVSVNDTKMNDVSKIYISVFPVVNNVTVIIYNLTDGKQEICQFNLHIFDEATLYLDNLTCGEYSCTVQCYEDNVYASKSITKNFKVTKLTPTINSSEIINKIAGDNITYNITLNNDANGTIKIFIFNQTFNGTVVNGFSVINISNIVGGNYNYTVEYSGDSKYDYLVFNKSAKVEYKNSSIDFEIKEIIKFDEYVIINPIVTPKATGTINIFINNIFNKTINVNETFTLGNLNVGNYSITFVYNGDKYYNICNKTKVFNISPINTNISVLYDNLTAGNTIINVTLDSRATGNITIDINNKHYMQSLDNGRTTFIIEKLISGGYNYTISYSGDQNFNKNSTAGYFFIQLKQSKINISAKNIIVGDIAKINYKITEGVTGNIGVYINNKFYNNVSIGDEIKLINITGGKYTIDIIYLSNGFYDSCNDSINLTVFKKSFVKLDVVEFNFNELIILNPVLTNGATGEIKIYVDNIYKTQINVGKTYTLSNLKGGNHTIRLAYSGDDYFAPCENTTILNVNKINTTISSSPTKAIAGNTVLNIVLNNKASGNITVNVNNKKYNETLSGGKCTVYIYDLPAGNYEYTIDYNGDQNFNQNTYKNDLNIQSKESVINISSNNIYVDEIAKINYTLTSGATGILSVYVNNEFVKNVSVGNNIELENLPYSNYTVKVIYNSDGYYATCQNTTTFKVQKLNPTFSFTKNNAIAGDEFVITYILNSDATGTIICNNSTKQLINGRVNFNINNIKGGLHQFNISYSGDDKYNPINKTVNVTIKFKDAIVDFDVKDIIWSDSLTIAPTLTAGATGLLNIYIDNNLNSTIYINGRKDFAFYVGGYHYIKVSYNGDEYYASNSTTKWFNVIKLNSTCDIKGNIETDNSATVYVTLNEDATGKVNIYIKGTKYSSNLIEGVATFRVPSLAAGTYSVTIDYEGDTKYASIYTTKSVEVTLKPTIITLNVKNILTGDNLVIKPIVTSSASGNLKIYVDNVLKKTIEIGSSYTIENPTIGSHNVRVVYAGDSYHQGNETKTSFRVFTFYPIEVQNTAIIYGTNKHFQAIFYDEYGNVVGNKLVAFSVDGEDTVVMTDTNGLAVFNKDLPIGTYTVTVINAYVNEEHDYNLKVFTSIESEDMTRAYNTGMDFKVKLLDENGDTLSKGYALFKVNNKDYPVVADNNGIAVLNANLPVGTYTVTTTNGRTGETKTNKITIVPSVNANNMVRGYNSGIDFKAQFLDADAKALINQKVAFIVDNVEYDVTTDANGYGVLNEQLDVGDYEVTIVNKVTGERAVKNLTIMPRIVENNKVMCIHGEESYYTICVVGDDGNFVSENEAVNININNIDYQIRTNKNGYASFRIDENIGLYDIFAEYKGYGVYNEVYVLEKVYYIKNLDIANIDYKQNALINLNLSSFDNEAYVEFDVVGDNGYNQVFDSSASNSVSLPITGLNAGKYTVTAKYYDLNTLKSSSAVKTFNVNKINPRIIVVVENANVGETATITVNIPDVEGNVEIKVGTSLTFNEFLVKNGVIIKEIDSLPAGTYNVDVTYIGDNNYNRLTQSVTLTIIQPKILTNIVASDITITQGNGATLVATLKDDYGKVLVGKGVSIYFNGRNSILTTDNNGQVKLTLANNLAPNTYSATITFIGDDYYVGSKTTVKVTINNVPATKITLTLKKVKVKRSAKKLTIQATLKINGKAVKGKTIKFKFNKKTYKARTNAKGVAKIKVTKKVLKKLKAGKKVKYQATYGKITKKVTVKVKK